MDAKRIIPVLQVRAGRVAGGHPADWAGRLELEGADGILFHETEGGADRAGWIRDVAASLSVPFVLEAPLLGRAELEEALEAGVDKVVLPARTAAPDPLLEGAVRAFGRSRIAVAVQARQGGPAAAPWRVELADQPEGCDALDWMRELEQRGAGEILLRAEPEAEAGVLLQGAARLALPVLFLCSGEPAAMAEALLHGADGVAVPAAAGSPRQWKAALGTHGLTLRD
jgi:imidazole glycerol phosphate synthase subunit HisF